MTPHTAPPWRCCGLPAAITLLSAVLASPAYAHTGEALAPHDLWGAWTWEPAIVLPIAITGLLYVVGVRRLWRNGTGRGIRRWEAGCFAIGWLVLVIALVSPLHPLGEVLFSAHMVQHELLMTVSAPLLVLGRPVVPWLHAVPMSFRRGAGGVARNGGLRAAWHGISGVGGAWLLQAIVLVVWHLPRLYDAAVANDAIHALQHVSFLAASLLFWWSLLHGSPTHSRRTIAVISLFTTAMYSTLLGALLAVSSTPWYSAYAVARPEWGLTPLEDQQLAGLIMWIPASVSYLAAALLLAAGWLRETKPSARRGWAERAVAAAVVVVAFGLLGCDWRDPEHDAAALTHGNPEHGQQLISNYGCGSCHSIPGIRGASGTVGPPLAGIASRSYIGGVLTNEPGNMERWLLDPPAVDSLTAMPNVGLNPIQARDVAAYLYTLQ
ncbi:MAG: cytochrome c oxidase assembly protein [Gemmatimonadaceae bacterium]